MTALAPLIPLNHDWRRMSGAHVVDRWRDEYPEFAELHNRAALTVLRHQTLEQLLELPRDGRYHGLHRLAELAKLDAMTGDKA